jgi:DNA-binding NarL/FixJ family response regulator
MNDLPKSEEASSRKRLMVVDDHPMSREGIIRWIRNEPDLEVCYEAQTASEALEAVIAAKPHLVLTDITLPGKSGLELIKDIRAIAPDLPVLVISMHDEKLYAERVLRAGANGYVTKEERGETIILAIRHILAGQIYLSQRMQGRVLQTLVAGRHPAVRSGIGQLSNREFEIFELVGQGLSTLQIARRLHLSSKTVDAHRANIKAKLDLKTTAQLISYAATWAAHEVTGKRGL